MLNKEVLECLEQNIEGAQKIAYYMNDGEGLSVQELMLDIKVDHFQGYEFLLAIMLLVTDDSAIERTRNRLFIRWFRKELEAKGCLLYTSPDMIRCWNDFRCFVQNAGEAF